MHRVSLAIILVLTAFASACNSGDIGDGDVRFSGSKELEPGDDAFPDGGEEDGGVSGPDEIAASDDAFPQDDATCPDAAAVVTASNGWDGVTGSQPAFTTLELLLMGRP